MILNMISETTENKIVTKTPQYWEPQDISGKRPYWQLEPENTENPCLKKAKKDNSDNLYNEVLHIPIEPLPPLFDQTIFNFIPDHEYIEHEVQEASPITVHIPNTSEKPTIQEPSIGNNKNFCNDDKQKSKKSRRIKRKKIDKQCLETKQKQSRKTQHEKEKTTIYHLGWITSLLIKDENLTERIHQKTATNPEILRLCIEYAINDILPFCNIPIKVSSQKVAGGRNTLKILCQNLQQIFELDSSTLPAILSETFIIFMKHARKNEIDIPKELTQFYEIIKKTKNEKGQGQLTKILNTIKKLASVLNLETTNHKILDAAITRFAKIKNISTKNLEALKTSLFIKSKTLPTKNKKAQYLHQYRKTMYEKIDLLSNIIESTAIKKIEKIHDIVAFAKKHKEELV